jgi:ribosomal protein L37E
MALASCQRCKKLYEKLRSPICPNCEVLEEDDYEKIRQALVDHPNSSAEQLAEVSGVMIECVLRLLAQGRIQTTAANKGAKCGRCGAPAISVSKKLCEGCLQKLNAELAQQQGKIKLPKKKSIEVGTALNTFEFDKDGDGRGGTKFRR